MQNPEIPKEVEEWLKDIGAHRKAAEHIGAFYNTLTQTTQMSETAGVQLTQAWMMVVYGWPKGMTFGSPDAGGTT